MSSLCYFLRWDLESFCPHVDLLVDVNAGDDKEDPGPPGPARQQPAQSEDDGSLVLLDHLDGGGQRAGQGEEDQQDGEESHQEGTDIGSLLEG